MDRVCSRGLRGIGVSMLVLPLILSAGCGSKGTVSGKVTYQDQPLRGGQVEFFTPDKKWSSVSTIDENGRYTIDKVPVGPIKIAVISVTGGQRTRSKFKERMPKAEDVPQGEDMPERAKRRLQMGESGDPKTSGPSVPKKYNDPDTSELTYDVKSGKQEHDIVMK